MMDFPPQEKNLPGPCVMGHLPKQNNDAQKYNFQLAQEEVSM